METNFSATKPPRHPQCVSIRPWIAEHLRFEPEPIKTASTAFVDAIKSDYKFNFSYSYDPEFALDLAELVLAKFRHKQRRDDSCLFPMNDDSPLNLTNVAAKTFALTVMSACKIKNPRWTGDFTRDLVGLVIWKSTSPAPKKRIKRPPPVRVYHHGPMRVEDDDDDDDDEAAKTKKGKKRPPVCVDHASIPFKKLKISL